MRTFFKTIGYTFAYFVSLFVRPKGVVVLMYHSVEKSRWPFGVDPEMFEKQMHFLQRHRTVISLADVVAYANGKKELPNNAVAITIDDGYLDTYTTVFPILKKYNMSATVFLTTDLSQMAELGNLPRPTWGQIKEMHTNGLVAFEVHGHAHEKLTDITGRDAFTQELTTCRDLIKKELSHVPTLVAYSYGAKSDAVLQETQQLGFQAAFGTYEGMVKKGSNLFALRRVQVDRTMSFVLFALRTTGAVEVYRRLKNIFHV